MTTEERLEQLKCVNAGLCHIIEGMLSLIETGLLDNDETYHLKLSRAELLQTRDDIRDLLNITQNL